LPHDLSSIIIAQHALFRQSVEQELRRAILAQTAIIRIKELRTLMSLTDESNLPVVDVTVRDIAATLRASLRHWMTQIAVFLRRWKAQIAVLLAVAVVAGIVGFAIHIPPSAATVPPSFVPMPTNLTMTRYEVYRQDQIDNWYYVTNHATEKDLQTFFQAQLPKMGWTCVTALQSQGLTYYGQSLPGTQVYITAVRGSTKAHIYLGDNEYGGFLLNDDLPDGAIALKISLAPAPAHPCP
jgi:hypothetical protein